MLFKYHFSLLPLQKKIQILHISSTNDMEIVRHTLIYLLPQLRPLPHLAVLAHPSEYSVKANVLSQTLSVQHGPAPLSTIPLHSQVRQVPQATAFSA